MADIDHLQQLRVLPGRVDEERKPDPPPKPPPPASDKPLVDVPTPDLTTKWEQKDPKTNQDQLWVPPMTGDVRSLSNGNGNATPPPHPGVTSFQVDPGILGAASLSMLVSANVATDSYTAARNYLNANKSWMFSVPSADRLVTPNG
jgi:hypothetical protein